MDTLSNPRYFQVSSPMTHLNRRAFLASTAAVAAPSMIPGYRSLARGATAPSDQIGIGVVGLGSRGFNLIDEFLGHREARIVAVCDVDRLHHRDRPGQTGPAFGRQAAEKKINAAYATRKSGTPTQEVQVHSDFRELIARDDIDAVVVATPDHWHAVCTLDAVRAGKDVYCEKPVTHMFLEGQVVYREVEKHKAVFQTGSQQRSDAKFRRAVELAHNGLLGKITRVEVGLPPGYGEAQGDATVLDPPDHLDYDFWCGPAPKLPYMRARHHRWWRGHRAFGGGVLMDWIGHHNDIAHWAMGVETSGPTRVEAVGWTFPETDVYNTPHQYSISCDYAGGVKSTISSQNKQGLKLIGEDGWVYVRRGHLEASDQRWVDATFNPGSIKAYRSENHTKNFLDCVRSRRACVAPAETGHRSITPGHLAYVSHSLGRALGWDPKSESVVDDPQADKLLRHASYRKPWSL